VAGVITENDVIERVSAYLAQRNWRVESTASTFEHGPDVIARSDVGKEIWIEAKGQTSSKEGSRRYGKEFSRSQKEDHLGRALLKCCQYISERSDLIVAVALPNDDVNSDLITRIGAVLQKLKIVSFLVGGDGSVEASGNLS